MEQQNYGNNSFTFIINNFEQKPKKVHRGAELPVQDYNFNSPGFGKNQWLAENDSLNGMRNKLFVSSLENHKNKHNNTSSFGGQTQHKLFQNSTASSKKRRKRKRKRCRNIEEIQKMCSTLHPNEELNTYLRDNNDYKKPNNTTIPASSYIATQSKKNSNNFQNVQTSNNDNVNYKKKRKKLNNDEYNTTNKYSYHNETNRPIYNGQFVPNSAKSNVNEKQDPDLFYFDICGNNNDKFVPVAVRDNLERLHVFKKTHNYNENFNNISREKKSSIKSSQPNLSNEIDTKIQVEAHKPLKKHYMIDESIIDVSTEDNYLRNVSDPPLFKKNKEKSGKTNNEKQNRNERPHSPRTDVFNCDNSTSFKDKKLSLKQTKKKRKKNKNSVNRCNDFKFLFENVNKGSNQMCDKSDVPMEINLEYLKSEMNQTNDKDKEEGNICNKKTKKQKHKQNDIRATINIHCDNGVSPTVSKKSYPDMNNRNNSINVFLENDQMGKDNKEDTFKIPHKAKRKKKLEKSLDSIVNITDSDCEIVDLMSSSPKRQHEHITSNIVEGDANSTSKKKCKPRIMQNHIQESILTSNINNTKNVLHSLPKISRESGDGKETSEELYLIDKSNFLKPKKKKHKKNIEDVYYNKLGETRFSKEDSVFDSIFEHNSNKNMLQYCYKESPENESDSIVTQEIVKGKESKAGNVNVENESDCEIIDYVSSNKKHKSIKMNFDANNTSKKKHKMKVMENDIQDNVFEITDNDDLENSLKLLRKNKKVTTELDKINIIDGFKHVKSKKKKHKAYSVNNYFGKPEIFDENVDDIEELEEEKYLDDIFESSKMFDLTSKNSVENKNKLLTESQGYTNHEVFQNIEVKTNRINHKIEIKHFDVLRNSFEDECEIIDYVSPNLKKKRKYTANTESDVYNTPKKKHKKNKIGVNNIDNTFFISEKNDDISEFNGLLQNGESLNYTVKEEIVEHDVLKNHNSISPEILNNEAIVETKDNLHRSGRVSDNDQSSDSSEIINYKRKSAKHNINSITNNALKLTENYIDESNTNETNLKTKVRGFDTSINISEDECEITDLKSINTRKNRRRFTTMESDANTPETATMDNGDNSNTENTLNSDPRNNNKNESHGENVLDEFNSHKAKKKKLQQEYNEKRETLREDFHNKQQKNCKELDVTYSIKREPYQNDNLEKYNNISLETNHLNNDETEDNSDRSQEIFDDQSLDGSNVKHNTEMHENGTSNSINEALDFSECHTKKANIGTIRNKTDLNLITKMVYESDNGEDKEHDDEQRKSCGRRREISVFAEYIQNKENIKSKRKSIIPEICTDPEEVQDNKDKIRELTVLFPFRIPPLHVLTTRITRPSKEQLEKIQHMNVTVKSGAFAKGEDEKIIQNWRQLCKEHNLRMNPSEFIKFPSRTKMETKLNIIRYIAHGLDDRPLHRVYIRFRHLLQKDHLKTGRFTPEEDKTIMEFMKNTQSRKPFSVLSDLLYRTKASVECRYEKLRSNGDQIIRWSPEMVDRLVKALMKITKCEKMKELKHRELTTKEWKKLSKKLDNIPVIKLQRAWKITIYPRLFSKEPDIREMKEDIIYILCDRNETEWKKVDWKEIATSFKGFTAEKIYMLFKHLIHFHVPKAIRSDLKECLDFLKNKFLKYNRIPSTHKFKKFVVKDGHITYDDDSD